MENIEITVIIPVYNSEMYLSECLDSIFNQDFDKPIEVIASINGSTDNSINILKEYKNKHDNLIIIENIKNIGAAVSRALAIKKARGKYISFIDSDDLYHPEFLKTMYKTIEHGYDVVGCNFYYYYSNKKAKRNILTCNYTYNSYQITRALLRDFVIRGFTWNKIYRREVFTAHRFYYPKKPRTIFEDVVTLYSAFMHIKSFKNIKTPLYYYRQNENSATGVKNKERFNHHLYCFAFIHYLCDQCEDKKYLRDFRRTYLRSWSSLWFDANLLRKEFKHGPLKHLHLFKRELKLLRSKKPLPIKGEVWEQYINNCLM